MDVLELGLADAAADEEVAPPQGAARPPQGGEVRHEFGERRIGIVRPVHPAQVVVLAIGVVVAALRTRTLVAHQQHRHALREEHAGQHVALLPGTKSEDAGIVGRTLDAVIGREVVAVAVAVSLAIGLVVLLLVGDRVGEGVAVMRGDEVDAGQRRAAGRQEDLARAGEPLRQLGERAGIPAPEAAQVVPELVVPLAPAVGIAAELVAAPADVPGLGDELDPREDGVLLHRLEEGGLGREVAGRPAETGGEIEAEARHAVGGHPVAQAVEHHPHHPRMGDVQGVAAAGAIDVAARIFRVELVVARIVDAAEGERRPEMVAFRRVVVDHIDQGLDAGRGEFADGEAQPARTALPEIARLGGEVVVGLVAPEIDEALVHEEAVVGEGLDRQEFEGGDAELQQVLDDRRMGEAESGAALGLRERRMGHGERPDMGLVDHRLVERARVGQADGIGRVGSGDHAAGQEGRAVAPVDLVLAGAAMAVAVERIVPADAAGDLAGIGVEDELGRVEAVPGGRVPRAEHPVRVELARQQAVQITVEDVVGPAGQADRARFVPRARLEQAEIDPGRILREEGEVYAAAVEMRAERRRQALLDDDHSGPS